MKMADIEHSIHDWRIKMQREELEFVTGKLAPANMAMLDTHDWTDTRMKGVRLTSDLYMLTGMIQLVDSHLDSHLIAIRPCL